MAIGQQNVEGRSLLGFGTPGSNDLGRGQASRVTPAAGAAETPARPDYAIISSGRDSEDDGPSGKRSDAFTALSAGLVLVVFMVVVGLLLS